MFVAASIYLYVRFLAAADHLATLASDRDESGQASAEYALVLLGAAAVALLLAGWAAKTDRLGKLLDSVFDQLLRKAR